jgi:hypothetical protein
MAVGKARPVEAAAEGAGWDGALAALESLLTGSKHRGRASVVISQRFARHFLLAPPAVWLGGNEMRAWLTQRLDASLDGAAAWQIAWQADAPGRPVLACAIETALLDGLRRVLHGAGIRPAAIQSWQTVAFNRRDRVLRRATGWYAVVEPGTASVMRLEQGRITALRQRNLGENPAGDLAGLIGREAMLNGLEAGGELWLEHHGGPAAWSAMSGLRVRELPAKPSLPEAMVAA